LILEGYTCRLWYTGRGPVHTVETGPFIRPRTRLFIPSALAVLTIPYIGKTSMPEGHMY
jgi:hypothetical protein